MDLQGVTVAFDLDGTLVDTAPDLIGALNAVLEEEGLAPLPLSSARHLVGRGARTLIERGFAEAGEPLAESRGKELVARFLVLYRGRIALESRPFPGVEEALRTLRAAGARLCVCTNKPTDLSRLLLQGVDLADFFEVVVGADAAPRPKPDASHLLAAISRAGGVREASLMVGDSETDVAAARASGVPVIAVPFGYREVSVADLRADRVAESFKELPAIVGDLAAALNRPGASAIGTPSPTGAWDA